MFEFFSEHPEALAALLSAIATGFAAYATWMGPRSAARLANDLQRKNASQEEQRRLKFWIFTALMQDRAMIWSSESVRALNLIDVLFKDCRPVREAWAELYLAFEQKDIPSHVQDERLRALLKAMASELGFADGLQLSDLGRVYYPNALAEENAVRRLELQEAMRRLNPKASPAANSAPQVVRSPYPPPPTPNQ